jgi:hypothetical protein
MFELEPCVTALGPAIVDAEGRYLFGRYTQPFVSANISDGYLDDYALWLRHPNRWNSWLRTLRLKEWHFISIDHPDIFLAFAVAQLGYVSNLFAYAVNKKTGRIHEWGERVPLGRNLKFGASSIQGVTVWQSRRSHLQIINQPSTWAIELKLDKLEADFQISRDEAMALVFPLAQNRAGYTHKEAGNGVKGEIQLAGETHKLTPENCLGASDWSRSFSNRITAWYFACFGGRDENGTRIGLNLSGLIYDDATGTSQENTVWIEGRSFPVGAARFILPDAKELNSKPWRIEAVDLQNPKQSAVALTFEPLGSRREHVSLGILVSKFTQAFGAYSGTISVNGHSYRVNRVFGVAEKHYSKW